jgi:hypothetical protein
VPKAREVMTASAAGTLTGEDLRGAIPVG